MARDAAESLTDIKRRDRQASPPAPSQHPSDLDASADRRQAPIFASLDAWNPSANPLPVLLGFLLALVLLLPAFALLKGYYWFPIPADPHAPVNSARKVDPAGLSLRQEPNAQGKRRNGSNDDAISHVNIMKDKLLGGLLSSDFEEGSCLSRYQSILYHKTSPYKPPPYLQKKLREYEALHKKCGPSSELYKKAIHQLNSSHNDHKSECKYLVWIAYGGLGNRIMSLVSSFLYALLTGRVLLVQNVGDMVDIFCEPFPHETWLLPYDFPLQPISKFDKDCPQRYGSMLEKRAHDRNKNNYSFVSQTPYVYVNLVNDYDDYDKLFFCDQDQHILSKFAWMIIRSNQYFLPALFLVPTFEEELSHLFPNKDTIFHLLGRYLLHPTNAAWGFITRYYKAYMARVDERIGIQIRIFNVKDVPTSPFQHVIDQILSCSLREKLLPKVNVKSTSSSNKTGRSKAILLTSLYSGYLEKIRSLYLEHPTFEGDIISVYQPSSEEYQQTWIQKHNMQAWCEMYLLSLTDKIVTSAGSTFGYVAQGLGGLKPWILYSPTNNKIPDPPCKLAMSMEPCFQYPPAHMCKSKRDTGALVPFVRHCEDVNWGIKMVD